MLKPRFALMLRELRPIIGFHGYYHGLFMDYIVMAIRILLYIRGKRLHSGNLLRVLCCSYACVIPMYAE